MSYWDKRTKIVVQNTLGHDVAVKNRFPASDLGASQSLPTILARLQTGEIEYGALVITVKGVQREDIARLMTGQGEEALASERDSHVAS